MKRSILGIILMIALSVCGLPAIAFAETTLDTQPTQQQPTQANAGNTLLIDNNHIYDGMDKPYKSGYMPSAANGIATIILPLTSAQELQGNAMQVSYDLGDPSTSPFQFGNYDQTVTLGKHKTDGGEQSAYLIRADLPLAANRIQGRYPVVIHTQGTLAGGAAFTQDFTVFVTITDGIDPNAPEPTQEPQEQPAPDTGGGEGEPAPQPKIMLSSYSVNPSPAVAGEVFHISATLSNTNENQSLDNVMVSVTGETSDVIPSGEGTGNFYYKRIKKGELITLKMDMVTSPSIEPKPQKLVLNIEYEGDKATAYTASEEIVIPIMQPIRLEYDEPQVPEDVNAGDTISVSLNIMNLGIGAVHNVRLSLEADGLIPDSTAFLGNIPSGEAKKGDMYVFVSTKETDPDSGSNEDKYGTTDGVMTLVYEDEYGKEYTETFEFQTNINPPVISAPQESEEEQPKQQGQWWVSVIIAGAVIAVILIVRAYIKKKREREQNEDERPV